MYNVIAAMRQVLKQTNFMMIEWTQTELNIKTKLNLHFSSVRHFKKNWHIHCSLYSSLLQ